MSSSELNELSKKSKTDSARNLAMENKSNGYSYSASTTNSSSSRIFIWQYELIFKGVPITIFGFEPLPTIKPIFYAVPLIFGDI